ncbi:MAG: TetR/AcrR family transcriptional regulator [Propionibacteriaceae bacterium]|jgi:AcrR family transcriptional regulator|nr:TetR/AcrR family transcriptional regulator [Propionibacteriaceae bacterium]
MSASQDKPDPTGPSGARGPYKTGIRRRQQILDTAVEVFGQYGYTAASLRRIAAAVGISNPALIKHFGSKAGLFTAVLEQSDRSDPAHADAFGDGSTGLAYFERLSCLIENNLHNRGLVQLLLTVATEASDPSHPANPFMQRRYRQLVSRMTVELGLAIERGEVAPMPWQAIEGEVRVFIALMDGLQLQWLLDPTVDLAATFKKAADRVIACWKAGL